MRKLIIAGNWKLNKTSREAIEFVTLLKRELCDISGVDIIVCPPATALSDVQDVLTDSNIALGAQNVYWEDEGAFTGEVSAPLLKDIGVQYVIIGHSERRQYFGETDETVNKRLAAALKHGLTPIVCVGENLTEREKGRTFEVLEKQCRGGLDGLEADEVEKIIIAYEPVWAIGTGKTATAQQAQEAHKFIRDLLAEMYNDDTAQTVRIQYGGSVKPENSAQLMSQPDIDGALVGGASLKAETFTEIIKNSCTAAQ
ncbi:MAG: triose-phosphate isomerase [Omnitrophica WOR_2 bacterium RIFCSPHIGHO2_02_FULL_52_10]|nr:MAG: triose-phosphate isomerase [Omnitrophica WOR_2 bacterium RIFCSPHIGHO2_02_FULL_52_10]